MQWEVIHWQGSALQDRIFISTYEIMETLFSAGSLNLNILFALCPLIFLAGFIDSIAGGGGLISLVSYSVFGLPGAYALGTNKFSSISGSVVASANYIRTGNYHLKSLVPAFLAALAGSTIGSRCALLIDEKVFSIILLAATPVIGTLVMIQKEHMEKQAERGTVATIILSAAVGLLIGFYDGFYGPGAGTFYQLGFIMLVRISARKACGNARMVNLASNLGALVTFMMEKRVVYLVAVPCAVFSILGNFIGSKLAIRKDIKIIKPMMMTVVGLLLVKLSTDLF